MLSQDAANKVWKQTLAFGGTGRHQFGYEPRSPSSYIEKPRKSFFEQVSYVRGKNDVFAWSFGRAVRNEVQQPCLYADTASGSYVSRRGMEFLEDLEKRLDVTVRPIRGIQGGAYIFGNLPAIVTAIQNRLQNTEIRMAFLNNALGMGYRPQQLEVFARTMKFPVMEPK